MLRHPVFKPTLILLFPMSRSPHPSVSGGAPVAIVDPTPIWQQRFGGLRWTDMPGSDTVLQKIHFALWRRGLVKVITDDAAPAGRRLGGSLLPMWGMGTSTGAGMGRGSASALVPGADPNGDVNADVDVDLDAGLGGAGDAESGANGVVGTKTHAAGPVKARPMGRPGRRRRHRVGIGKLPSLPEESRATRELPSDWLELVALRDRICQEAAAAGMTLNEAALEGGMYRDSLKPSQLLEVGAAQRARMVELLEKLVQRNHQGKEGA